MDHTLPRPEHTLTPAQLVAAVAHLRRVVASLWDATDPRPHLGGDR